MKKLLTAMAVLLLHAYGVAAVTSHGRQMKIVQLFAYSDFGGGDVVFITDDPTPGCEEGFWLRQSDPGFKPTLAIVMSAYQAKSPVRVWGYNDQLWSGSSGKYCRLYTINPV